MSKADKEKLIYDKMQERYAAYTGKLAEELQRRTKAALKVIEDG